MTTLRSILLPVAAAGLLAVPFTNAQTPPPVRIMPLGDSITLGTGTPGGYRYPLYVALTNAGYNVDYVGTQTGNATNLLPKINHQGMSGWRISGGTSGLSEYLLDWFNVIADPDVILLHIGTNDFGTTNDYPNAINRLDALVTQIATNRPFANIIVTTLLPRAEPYNTWITTTFNPFVPGRVAAQRALGRKVYYLDMNSCLTTNDLFDALHPNAAGYAKMAAAWFPAITNIIGTLGDLNAPAMSRALGITNLQQVTVTFSKALNPASATNLINYSINGGLTLTGAALSADQRSVTLTTSRQTRDTLYTLTVNNVTDILTPTPLTISPGSAIAFKGVCRGYLNNVAEAAGYLLAYSLDIPNNPAYTATTAPYTVDNRLLLGGPLGRIAYYMELQTPNGQLTYLWASMDAFTNDVALIGVPVLTSGAVFQKQVANLTVSCNAPGIVTGTGLTGNLEFWPSNYSAPNYAGVPGASGAVYDFGDQRDPGTYGCMQLHNFAAGQTLFAFNNWGSAGNATADLGIGNCPNPKNGGIDWTFDGNAGNYTIKTLQVLVTRQGIDTTPPTIVSAQAGTAGTLVNVTFSEPLAADSVNGTCFALDNGVQIISATLLSDLRTVTLTTTPQPVGASLTLTVNGMRDSNAGNPIAPNASIAVTAASVLPPEISANVGALASGYQLVYTLDIPVTGNFNGSPNPYRYNQSLATGAFDRVAYYLELVKPNATTQYIWTSMDTLTPYRSQIGVPIAATKAVFQQNLSNQDVKSNVAGITNGTGMAGGNIEFWPTDYAASNAVAVPGASNSTYDFGDSRSLSGAHGSMQVHNYLAKQTLFAISNFGADNQILGIGIGNQTVNSPDWTQSYNAGTAYLRRTLHILARPSAPSTNALPPEIAANIPNAVNYQLVCSITNIPVQTRFQDATNYYTFDRRSNVGVGSFSRVAYYMELQKSGDPVPQYVWTAMDAFTTDPTKIGVPVNGTFFQQKVTNLDVLSNVGGIVTGNSIATGNIEFWPSSYSATNSAGITGASNSTFDFGDGGASSSGGGYGSMQIHNYGASQTLFAMNNFNTTNSGSYVCLGIGNQPTGNPDWTHAFNAATYDLRRVLHVLVLPGGESDTTRPSLISALGSTTLKQILVSFSEPLADSAAAAANFTLNGGASVTGATMVTNKTAILLTTTVLTAGQTYTVSVTGVRDRSSNGNVILPGSTIAFTAPPVLPSNLTSVPDVTGYELIYQLAMPNVANFVPGGAPYAVDQSKFPRGKNFDRVAYFMDLADTNGVAKWVWVSFDAFTPEIAKIGVPTAERGAFFQQYVSNMNVYASANASVTAGTAIVSGNIEFWPSNYSTNNAANIPNASNLTYDFGDGGNPNASAGHGSMQIHNYLMGHTIFSFSHFGSNGNVPAIGIGNNPSPSLVAGQYDLDWTFTYNAAAYTNKSLYVLARPGATPASISMAGTTPVIFTQPQPFTVRERQSFFFSVQATGATRYQWRLNGVPIDGATLSYLYVPVAKVTDKGAYDVLAYGSGTAYTQSQSAGLNVLALGTMLKLK